MLKLRYSLKRDPSQYVTVLGDPAGIRNLYWQLTHNYMARDGQEIGAIEVTDFDGNNMTASVMSNPFACSHLSTMESL